MKLVLNYQNIFETNNEIDIGNGNSHSWDDETETLENVKRKLKAFFEIMLKLGKMVFYLINLFQTYYLVGLKYWTASERDLLPHRGSNNTDLQNIDEITDFINDLQQKTGIKLILLSASFPYLW